MAPMRATRAACALPCLLAAAALLPGCGGGSGSTASTSSTAAESAPSRPAPPPGEFPSAKGRTLRQVLKAAKGGPAEVVIAPEAMVFYPGENRYPFEVYERDGASVTDAEVALYYSRVPSPHRGAKSKTGSKGQLAKAEEEALDQPAVGPFPGECEAGGGEGAPAPAAQSKPPRPAGALGTAGGAGKPAGRGGGAAAGAA